MRILKPGEPCPCCGTPIRDDLPRWKLLLLSYIAEGLSLMDAINVLAEVMEVPPLPDKAEAPEEVTVPDPRPDAPAPTSSEAEEKRAIVQRMKDYRAVHGPGCLAAVSAKTAYHKNRRISDDVLRHICADGTPKMPIQGWRSIGKALNALQGDVNGKVK